MGGIETMAVIKCKMCGGDLNFADGASVADFSEEAEAYWGGCFAGMVLNT